MLFLKNKAYFITSLKLYYKTFKMAILTVREKEGTLLKMNIFIGF